MGGFFDYFRWSWSWWNSPEQDAPSLTYLSVSAETSLRGFSTSQVSAFSSISAIPSLSAKVTHGP